MLLNKLWITEETKEEKTNTWRQMKMKIQWSKMYGTQQTVLRGKNIAIQTYLRKQEKSQKIPTNFTPKQTRKRINKTQS